MKNYEEKQGNDHQKNQDDTSGAKGVIELEKDLWRFLGPVNVYFLM